MALFRMGGLESGGRFRAARLSWSRTSLAAVSRSVSSVNSTVIWLTPSRLVEVRLRIPETALTASSIGSVICACTTSDEAPG